MEIVVIYLGYIGIMEKNMETTRITGSIGSTLNTEFPQIRI